MALLAAPYYRSLLLILFSNRSIGAYTPTSIRFFNDTKCQNLLYTVQTDTDVNSGICNPVNGVNSVYPELGDFDCAVTVYSDLTNPSCGNNTDLASYGNCTTLPIRSYSVDCQINGNNSGNYTTIYPSPGETSTISATPPTALSSIVETNPLISINSLSSSLAASSSSHTLSAFSTGAPPSPPPSPAPKQSDGNDGLSRAGRIGLGIGLGLGVPGILGIYLVIYVTWKWKKRRRERQPSDSSNRDVNPTQSYQNTSTTHQSESEDPINGNIPMSEPFLHAKESFASLPKAPPGKLYY